MSACLLGAACRYDGRSVPDQWIQALAAHHRLIPVCPEIYGGLPTPRPPAEIQGTRVCTRSGTDVTEQYEKGAIEVLRLATMLNCKWAILKEKSPSCGSGRIYDGTFSGTLTSGYGKTAALLRQNGITVISETEAKSCPDFIGESLS